MYFFRIMSLISSKACKYDIKVEAMTLELCLALAKCQHCDKA